MPFFMHFMSVFTLYSQNVKDIYEMRGKQGANMLIRVATLMGQDQFYFSHYFLTMAIAFLGIAAMLREQYLAIARVECSIFLFKINWNGLNVFTLISVVKKCFLIRIFAIRTAKKNKLSLNQEVPLYIYLSALT